VSEFIADIEVVDVEESQERRDKASTRKLKVSRELKVTHHQSRNVSVNNFIVGEDATKTTCSDSSARNVEIHDRQQHQQPQQQQQRRRRSLADRVSSVGDGEATTSGTDANNVETPRGDVDQAVRSLIGYLHDPANVQHNICWKFAGRLLNRVNTP